MDISNVSAAKVDRAQLKHFLHYHTMWYFFLFVY